MGPYMSGLLVLSYFLLPQSRENGMWSQESAGNGMQGKHLLWGQFKHRTKIHTMQAVKGERLQHFVEGRLPYKGKRPSSLEMTKGKKGESNPYSYSSWRTSSVTPFFLLIEIFAIIRKFWTVPRIKIFTYFLYKGLLGKGKFSCIMHQPNWQLSLLHDFSPLPLQDALFTVNGLDDSHGSRPTQDILW